LLLEGCSISELLEEIPFRGFLLDINKLFEKFVERAFIIAAKGMNLEITLQEGSYLSDYPSGNRIQICPDVVVKSLGKCLSIVDAKYKRTDGSCKNHDFCQVLSYATALNCLDTRLFYPASEYDIEESLWIRNSSITVHIHRIDIEDRGCVHLAEKAAREVLLECLQSLAALT
jgi:5-methylcytosine-specific restriction endonuclease McrBC regulatory subunit McrC